VSEHNFDYYAGQSPYSSPQNGRRQFFVALLRHYADHGGPASAVRVLIGDGDGFEGAMAIAQEQRARVAIIADDPHVADFYADRAVELLCGYHREDS
jgi:hypothetical protein